MNNTYYYQRIENITYGTFISDENEKCKVGCTYEMYDDTFTPCIPNPSTYTVLIVKNNLITVKYN